MENPLISKWLTEGKFTCSIPEFAKLYGFSEERAYQLCKSADPPPGFLSGNRYHILVQELPAYMSDLAKKRRTINA